MIFAVFFLKLFLLLAVSQFTKLINRASPTSTSVHVLTTGRPTGIWDDIH